MWVFDAGGAVVSVDGNGWLGGSEQSAALDQLLSADAIGEEAEVTNADQSGRQHAEQEAADEFDRIESHDLGTGVIRVVFPVKADAAVFQSTKAVVGDGDAMSVASQILEHTARSADGRLDVDHPFEVGGFFTQGLERGVCGIRTEAAGTPSWRLEQTERGGRPGLRQAESG